MKIAIIVTSGVSNLLAVKSYVSGHLIVYSLAF